MPRARHPALRRRASLFLLLATFLILNPAPAHVTLQFNSHPEFQANPMYLGAPAVVHGLITARLRPDSLEIQLTLADAAAYALLERDPYVPPANSTTASAPPSPSAPAPAGSPSTDLAKESPQPTLAVAPLPAAALQIAPGVPPSSPPATVAPSAASVSPPSPSPASSASSASPASTSEHASAGSPSVALAKEGFSDPHFAAAQPLLADLASRLFTLTAPDGSTLPLLAVSVKITADKDIVFDLTFPRPNPGTLRLTANDFARVPPEQNDVLGILDSLGNTLATADLSAASPSFDFAVPAAHPRPPANPHRNLVLAVAVSLLVLAALAAAAWQLRRRPSAQ